LESRTLLAASLLADINLGILGSSPGGTDLSNEANVNGVLFFRADNGITGQELWKTDGTALGTVLVADINLGLGSSAPSRLTNVNGTLFFRADNGVDGNQLWKSDGTATGTVAVGDVDPTYLTNVNGTLFFRTSDVANGFELWKSDGTALGTALVKDINPGAANSFPQYFTNVNGTLYFRADDGTTSRELWKSDGTAAGTVLVKDIRAGSAGSSPQQLTNVNGTVFFRANDGPHGYELWKTDGTAGGTVLVKDITPGSTAYVGYGPGNLTNVNGTLFFETDNGVAEHSLWKSDGTTAGTVLLKDINAAQFEAVGSALFFVGDSKNQLWKSDGTPAGTVLVKNFGTVANDPGPEQLTNVNGTVLFRANDGIAGTELWQSDGTAAGTVLLKDIKPGSGGSNPLNFLNINGTVFLSADNGLIGQELWTATTGLATDVTGASVTSVVFSGTAKNTFDKAQITFSEAINPTTFTIADIGSFVEPGGGNAIPLTAVTPVVGTQNQFIVTFPTQTVLGKYSFTTSVDILDLSGNQMNQDGDTSNGEDGQDQFTANGVLGLAPFVAVGNSGGSVRIVNSTTGAVISTIRPLDDGGTQYTGLVQVAVGDFNGDAVPDLLVSAASPSGAAGLSAGKAGKVFVYDGASLAAGTVPATPFRTFTPFATTDGPAGTSGAFVNGLNIATGDVNGDGNKDLIAGSRGGNGSATGGLVEFGRLVVIDGTSAAGSNTVIGGIQKPFGAGYQKGVVVAAGNADGVVGDEIAVTRGGPVASQNATVQQIKVKVLKLQGSALSEVKLSADGSTSFAPFGGLSGAANAINRDGRVAFVDTNGDGKAELVFTALDPLTDPSNRQVRVGVYSINVAATAGAATIVSTGTDAGTYLTGFAVLDHAITHVAGTGTQQNLAVLTESDFSGAMYLAPLSGLVQSGGFPLDILQGGISIDGI